MYLKKPGAENTIAIIVYGAMIHYRETYLKYIRNYETTAMEPCSE